MKHSLELHILTTIVLVLFFLPSKAQEFTFSGAIVIDKTEVLSYTITYTITEENILTGFSISDLNGKEETKAQLTGKYNAKEKTLSFDEKKIVYSKGETPSDEFCLMKVKGKIEKKGGKTIFTGDFNAVGLSDDIICASGTLILLSEKDISELSAKASKVIQKLPKVDSIAVPKVDPTPWSRNVFEIESGKSIELELKSDQLIIELVDDRFQDGDRVSVLKNGVKVINNLELTNRVQSFKYEIGKEEKEITFSFIAEDEGSIALTTFKAVIKNGRENNLIMTSLNKGEKIKVIFKRK
ncbi:MAG: hypothetical protein RBR28_06945 [Lentimicrobium sp.]|jgi:hypothetical protein|nr:hypothetical protein [Lentimicrobium sp.]